MAEKQSRLKYRGEKERKRDSGKSGLAAKGRVRWMLRASVIASLPALPALMQRMAQAEGERKGFRVEQFKLTARDGTKLSAALYVPRGEGPFPALVMVHSWMLNRWQCHLYAPYFASSGYVVLAYDCRGWGSSGGEVYCADPDHELNDLEDAINWLTERSGLPLKEGALGVTGISYGGGHSFLIALRDPRVRTVVPMAGWTDLSASLAPGGSVKFFWGFFLVLTATWATRLNPRNPLYRWTTTLLLGRGDRREFEENMRRRSCLHLAEECEKPMLIVGSWNDDLFEPNQMMDFYLRLKAPKMLYISNGIHGLDSAVGPRWAGKEIWELTRRWFDYWLKEEENGILDEPPVRLYRPWKKRVEAEEEWPPRGIRTHTIYLGRDEGQFKLTSKPKGRREEAVLRPRLLTPANSGPSIIRPQAMGLPVPGPRREAGDGFFSFTTSPAKRDFELLGIPRLRLRLVPRDRKAQVNALLYDVPPEDGGLPRLITYGTLTLEDVEPGRETEKVIELVAADYLLPRGHRFRLTLSGSNPTFVLPVTGKGLRVVYGDGLSYLELPLRESSERGEGS
ncbi:CocE/NonD family hydrolase [Candidatus Solincola sp.]